MAKKKAKENLIKTAKFSESYLSMGLGLLVVIVAGILIFNFFKGRATKLTLPGVQAPGIGEQLREETAPSLPTTHIVRASESLWTIAENYYGSAYNWVTLSQANNLNNPDHLLVGQELKVPEAEKIEPLTAQLAAMAGPAISEDTYTVVKSDSLWKITIRAYGDGYQWAKIAQANNLTNPDLIHPGNVLKIPR